MNKNYFYNKSIIVIVLVVTSAIMILSGCGVIKKISSSPDELSQENQQTNKAPKDLMHIETTIEEIFQTLGAPALGQKEKQESMQLQSSENKGGSQSGDDNKNNGSASQEDNTKEDNTKDNWSDISVKVESLHLSWNEYMPQAVEKGANNNIIDDFGSALNTLTTGLNDREEEKSILAANNLYAVIPELYSLYEKKDLPQLKKIIFYTRSCILYSLTADWTSTDSFLEELKSAWTIFKNTLKEEQKQKSNKVDLSIYELEKVVQEQNSQLANIKGRITLVNIEELEKTLENEEQ